jgi:hypothetical protein
MTDRGGGMQVSGWRGRLAEQPVVVVGVVRALLAALVLALGVQVDAGVLDTVGLLAGGVLVEVLLGRFVWRRVVPVARREARGLLVASAPEVLARVLHEQMDRAAGASSPLTPSAPVAWERLPGDERAMLVDAAAGVLAQVRDPR